MRTVLVCGGRAFGATKEERQLFRRTMNEIFDQRGYLSGVITGGAKGADSLALMWARRKRIPCSVYQANWTKFGPAAGPIRNAEMLEKGMPDLVVAFPGGRGTSDMVTRARMAGVPVQEVTL